MDKEKETTFEIMCKAAIQLWLDSDPKDGYAIDLYHCNSMTSFTVYFQMQKEAAVDFYRIDDNIATWARAIAKLEAYLK